MTVAERSVAVALRALRGLAAWDGLDRVGMRDRVERLVYVATRDGARAGGAASRAFVAANRLRAPVRSDRVAGSGLFDLTPTDEQQMLREAFGDFATERLRPAAQGADEACTAEPELLAQANELGVNLLGVPEELGGAVSERSSITAVLVAEALARGDMGLAAAALAPGAVATALSLWGDAGQ